MEVINKTKEQLIKELEALRQRTAELEKLETQRKRAEEALRQSEEKLRLMFESVTEGVTVSDLEGKIVEVNDPGIRMYGADSKDELIGRSSFEFMAEKDHAKVMDNLKKTLEGGV